MSLEGKRAELDDDSRALRFTQRIDAIDGTSDDPYRLVDELSREFAAVRAEERAEGLKRNAKLRAAVEAARQVPSFTCFVTKMYPEHMDDCACAEWKALEEALAAIDAKEGT